MKNTKKIHRPLIIVSSLLLLISIFSFSQTTNADTVFDPSNIISDALMQDYTSWSRDDVQRFLDSKGSYLRSYSDFDENNNILPAADIIMNAARDYQINPKFLLVTLQKEQSLVTDDSPTERQLNWATGYAVCDSCSTSDPKVLKFKGFGKQVANAAGIIRWYYNNQNNSIVKKAFNQIIIDDTAVVPQSWATAFLYTYTPHLHGNKNFARIWNTWFSQFFPDGTLLKSASTSDYYLIQDGKKRKFTSLTAVITRTDPKLAITVSDTDLTNYQDSLPISFPNYSILRTNGITYLLDSDTLRPFASQSVVAQLGFSPEEINDVTPTDIAGLFISTDPITATSTAPTGIIYQITDLGNTYYLLKDNIIYPITDKKVIEVNFKDLAIEKHSQKELKGFSLSPLPLTFRDGTLLQVSDSSVVYVIDKGKKRRIADDDSFRALGYKRSNITAVSQSLFVTIPEGEKIFTNTSLLSSRNKFLGDSAVPIADLFKTDLPKYLVAEYPSGRLIAGKNIDSPMSLGSLSGLIEAYEIIQDDLQLSATTVFDDRVIKAQKNSLSLKRGEKIKNSDLLSALLLSGPKDVAFLVSQGIGGNDTVSSNIRSRLDDWGADSTVYSSVDGEEANKTSPRDVLKIAVKTLDDSTIAKALGQTSITVRKVISKGIGTITLKNSNQIITKYPLTKRNYKILATTADTWNTLDKPVMMVIESKKDKKQYVIITAGQLGTAQSFEEAHKIATWISNGSVK